MQLLPTILATSLLLTALAPAALADGHADFGKPRPARVAAVAEPTPGEPPSGAMPAAPPARDTTVFGLPRNVGPGDRVLRTVIWLGLAGAGIYGLASGELSDTTSGVLLGVSAVPLATAATGYCPLYQVLGIERSF